MQVENLSTCSFSRQHNTFSALNYAQDFATTVKKSLFEEGYTHETKVELSRVKCFHAFVLLE